jgi:hypothetical protein
MSTMTQEEIAKLFDGAPEGATHFRPGCHKYVAHWVKLDGESRYMIRVDCDSNFIADPTPRPLSECIPRPSSPAWSGPQDGLPPVGIDLQWFSPVYGWIGGKVVAHDGQTIIVRHNDGYEGCYLHNVKACRTPEQIAADQREAAINEMVDDLQPSSGGATKLIAERFYLAGYRKVEQPK